MIYPAIQIDTQWVMVDKTRIPSVGEWFLHTYPLSNTIELGGVRNSPRDSDYVKHLHKFEPILAAFPKLEGVPLIPEYAFKTPNMKNIVRGTFKTTPEKLAFDSGIITAGGYTRDDIKQFPEWLYDGGWEFNAIARCWAHVNGSNKTTSDLVDIYINSLQKLNLPTAFDCEENQDGSPKIENDTIVLKNVIR